MLIVIKDPLDHIVDVLNGVYCLGRIIGPAYRRAKDNRNLRWAHFVAWLVPRHAMQETEQEIDQGPVVDFFI